MAANGNALSKSRVWGNKWRPFKTHWLSKSAIPKLWRGKRTLLVVLLLASMAVALASFGVWRAVRPAPSLASVNAASTTSAAVKSSAPPATTNPPFTKLKEYVYAGGRLVTSEEISCVPTLSPASASSPQGGGPGSFNFSLPSICNWTATSNIGWITVTSGLSGSGNGTVSYSVAANSGPQRVGTITVNGEAFTITQAPSPASCGYSLSKTNETFPQQGGSEPLALTAGAGCAWNAVSSDTSWLTASPTNGVGPATINYSVAANGGQQRAGSISITAGGQTFATFTVTQAPNQASCTFALNPSSLQYPVEGGGGSFSVTTGAGCFWDAANANGWITITGGATGVGSGTVFFTVHANNGGSRTGGISVRGQVFTITQAGCSYSVSPTRELFPKQGGSSSVTVSTAASCPWTATSSASWITIASGATGTGNGSVDYSVSLFTGTRGRAGFIHVAGKSVTIEQENIEGVSIRPNLPTNRTKQRSNAKIVTKPHKIDDDHKYIGTLFPLNSDSGPKGTASQPIVSSQKYVGWISFREVALFIAIVLITAGVLALIVRIIRSNALRRFVAYTFRQIWEFIARLEALVVNSLEKILQTLLRLPYPLRRALVIALVVRLAAPLTPAEADGLTRAAQTTWRMMSAYTIAAANRYSAGSGSELINRSIEAALGRPAGKVVSAASQAEQVAELQVCPRQLVMFVGERYTLTPVALDASHQVVHLAGMSWSSSETSIADVSSFGQVIAKEAGTTTVQVQSGSVIKQIQVEVRSGTRPTGSNQEADIDPTGDCSEEQASMFAPRSVASAQQNLLEDEDGVQRDGDPLPALNSLAAHFRNAVGNPRFSARSQASAAVPTSTQLGSYNYQFNVPVASVGGRGASAGIGMTLNSRVWNTDDGGLTFNYVGAYPAPGWTMGYGKIIRNYNATATGDKSGVGSGNSPGDYLLVSGDGTRTRLAAKYDATANRWLHESDDGSFLQFDPMSGEMRYLDGSRMIYSSVNGCLLPTAMINSNGGAITMTYRDYCEGTCVRVFRHRTALSAVRDTLGRYVTFHYYGDGDYTADAAAGRPAGELAAIKAPDMDGVQQEVIRVEYQPIILKYDFGGIAVNAPANNSQIQVVRRVHYPQTGRGFLFLDYSSYGMPRKISSRMGMNGAVPDGVEIAYTTYNYTTIDPGDPYGRHQVGSLNDFPQFRFRKEWWQDKIDDSTGLPTTEPTVYEYSRTTNASTEVATMEYVGKNCKEVTTTGTDSSQLSFGKVISVERKKSEPEAVLSKQVFTYMTGPGGEPEIEKKETFDEAGQGTLVSFSYGPYGRVINQYEYGYKQAGVYQVRRRTQYDYVDAQSYLDNRFLRLVRLVTVYDAAGAPKAKTETFYDDYEAMGGIESHELNASEYPPNHDATYDQTKVMRGNATAVKTFSNIASGEATTRRVRYDIFGNVVEAELSCCVKKYFGFSVLTYYSQPDWVRSGPESETELNLKTSYRYNDFTGLVENETNPDGWRTTYEYDSALRLKTVTNEATGAVAKTQFEQDGNGNDLLTYISQTSYDDQGTQRKITSKRWLDGAGRAVRAGTGTGDAPDSYDMAATIYDGWGRVAKRSNPYLGDASGNLQGGVTQFWATNTYDELSRVVTVTLPDDQLIQRTYRGATATSGATGIVTDTVGRQRKVEVDGLGRLVKVTEQNPANGNLEWETSYSYDALDNLTQVNQGGQFRTFMYDDRSRLRSETTLEAGTTIYEYTDFDAVSTRTDARGVVTTYTYGPLNLLTEVKYDTALATGVAATTKVSFTHKSASPGKGQVETVTDGAGNESYGYDSFGRLQSCTRVIDGIRYEKRYEYNAIGQLTLMTYPSGKRVKMERDSRGRPSALQRVDDFGTAQETYLNEINYRVDGQVSSQNLGDGTTETFGYSNDRLQLTSQTVMKGGSTLLNLSYGYEAVAGQMGSVTTSGNSGQLVSVTGTVNGQDRNQTFNYDNVGRLLTATGTATGLGAWARRFDYDRWGNRTAVRDAVSGGNPLQNTVIGQSGGMTTNRIASVNGTTFNYDASGNVTWDGARTYTYDAVNRIVGASVSVSGLSSESYGYDAGSRRVKKEAEGVVTHYIWEGDQVIAEYERGNTATQATGTRYYHQDRLSTRVITDGVGAVVGAADQLPFGEEIGVSGEGEKHKFTTYERDGTGLDYAMNRFYSSQHGRFAQVDPLGLGAASLTNPQSLNLYSYVRNDPVNFVDPTGLITYPGARYDPALVGKALAGGITYALSSGAGILIVHQFEPIKDGNMVFDYRWVGLQIFFLFVPSMFVDDGGQFEEPADPQDDRETTPADKRKGPIQNCNAYFPFLKKEDCTHIAEVIKELTRSIHQRFDELIPGSPTYDNHKNAINLEREELNKCISKFKDNNCGDGSAAMPPGFDMVWAEDEAGRKFPRPASFKDAVVNRGLGVPVGVAVVTACLLCPLCCAVAGIAGSKVPAKP